MPLKFIYIILVVAWSGRAFGAIYDGFPCDSIPSELCCVAKSSSTPNIEILQVYESENLVITQLSKNSYLHTSFLKTESFGKVACNGMIVADQGEAIVFDTAIDDTATFELIRWIETQLNSKVTGVVVTHFHVDCLGGLNAFHSKSIPSYAHIKTLNLAEKDSTSIPRIGFSDKLQLKVGNRIVISEYLGEGHTKDNIIGYFPSENILFGGCLIKGMSSNKGNLADANEQEWSSTVTKVKTNYAGALIIVPGHGNPGGPELLDYTIELFEKTE